MHPDAPRAIDSSPFQKLQRVLAEQGVLAALRVLNSRAPHRYTGIFQYTPTILKNVYLVDAFDANQSRGADIALEDAYCSLLPNERRVAFGRAEDAPAKIVGPVVSYCGVLLVRASGEPFGSLCHFDTARCQQPLTEMPYLEALAPEIVARLEAEGH